MTSRILQYTYTFYVYIRVRVCVWKNVDYNSMKFEFHFGR